MNGENKRNATRDLHAPSTRAEAGLEIEVAVAAAAGRRAETAYEFRLDRSSHTGTRFRS